MIRLRSLLFAPGNEPRKIAKLPSTGADGVIVDLEDAVPEHDRADARALTGRLIADFPPGCFTVVRVNAAPEVRRADLEAVVCDRLDAIMVPKLASAEELQEIAVEIDALEASRGLAPGSIRLLPLIESAAALVQCESIALAVPARTLTLVLGCGDLTLDLGVDLVPGSEILTYAGARIVVAARAAGLASPVDGPFPDLSDDDGLGRDSRHSRGVGFGGRLALHPGQVETIHAAYSLLDDETVKRMAGAIAHFEAERDRGIVATVHDGQFLDPPVYERMRSLLSAHMQAGGRP